MPRDPRWLTIEKAGEVLGVSRVTFWRLASKGELPGVRTFRPSKTTYYWQPDLERLVAERGGRIDDGDDEHD
jgi:excisionase family DNA binding protein